MSNRRMFSNRIANSARFLQMPTEAQVLYFHMILRADDDGVVESYPLMKLLGIAPDNFKVLLAKGFIKQLNEDQVVVIEDWLEHNTIRADRKVDSIYKNLLLTVAPEIKLIEPKPRSDVEDNSKRLGGLSTVSISQVKLSKDNTITLPLWLDKDSWNEWITYRKGRKLTNSKITLDKQIKLLEKFKDRHKVIIEKSITNGWQGLFPERDSEKRVVTQRYGIQDTRNGKISIQTFISEQEAKKFINMKSEWELIKDKLKVIHLTE